MKRLEDYQTEMETVVEEAQETGGDGSLVYYGMMLVGVVVTGTLTYSLTRRGMNGSELWGDWLAFAAFLPVVLLEGSALALSPKRLGQVIARWADERVKLRNQVAEQKSELDEYAFLREYADKYGITLDRFKDAAEQIPASLDSLIKTVAAQKVDFRITWSFSGTLHFIDQHAKLAPYRLWLNTFFAAAQGKNREAVLEKLREAQARFDSGGR